MSVRSILVPLDGSALAESALPFATRLARASGGSIHVLSVVPDPFVLDPGLRPPGANDRITRAHDAVEAYVDGVVARVGKRVPGGVSGEVAFGVPADCMVEAIRRVGIDFVVMTSHGRGGFTRFWLGSVTDAFVRRAPVPVFVVKAEDAEAGDLPDDVRIGGVLVPLDGSPLAEIALSPATELARLLDAPITLLMVLENPLGVSPGFVPYAAQYDPVVPFEQNEQAGRYLEVIADRIRARGFSVDIATSDDLGVARTIVDYEREKVHGVIVIATNGRGGWRRLVTGSVADKVVRHAECPVVMVRPVEAPPRFAHGGAQAEWPKLLADFNERNAARPVRIEIDTPLIGAQREVEGLELTGVHYDPRDDRFAVAVRGRGLTHLTHSISAPARIDAVRQHGCEILAVQHDGGQTLIRCATPEPGVDDANDAQRVLAAR